MRKVNNLTYLNLSEIHESLKKEVEDNDKFNKTFSEEDILHLLVNGEIRGIKIEGNFYANQCELKHFIDKYVNVEIHKLVQYGGAVGINLTDVKLNGKILDIGGGGEGIIGQLKGDNVIAIDSRRDELEEAKGGPLKIVMDAKELMFLDNTFDTVTSFFTLMYIPSIDHQKVLEEIYRVLKQDGEFVLWDTVMSKKNNTKDFYSIFLEIQLPNKSVLTGYGVGKNEQSLNYFIELAEKVGFKVVNTQELSNIAYNLRLRK
ncbi:class I SAM-dependent methyltransferase [Mycoplasmatota bacterium]|nr:class I SAM-dependent methyltransferase [Mycoplasmatota bacterium]